ncbi:MAG: polyhydroxyalkanoate synthesis regulator DNA-binding domain-containing protein [Syntrophales bacterium]|jgi:polyhydroxyalkanoate synthesis repressor PhaR|nr:polyhydroxyalkanoate synthesis regulator DNA-binding domain-containing protein [Syntrophales bacterium]
MPDRVLLKKYANRRLYDMERSVYVTLEDIADLIRRGREVVVTDARTEEDVTAFILTQIVLEEARKKNILLPVSLLHLMIHHGDKLLGEFFDKYLEQSLKNFLRYKSMADAQFAEWLKMGADFSEQASLSIPGAHSFPNIFDLFAGAEPTGKTPSPSGGKPGETNGTKEK